MARRSSNESTSDLYIRLGLSLDELESGFVDAERTLRDNMSRISRANRIIELQLQVDLSGLDEAADAEEILAKKTEALNKLIKGQQDRVRLAAAELRNMAQRHGENSDQAQKAQIQLEHERVALAKLEEQLAHVGDTAEDAGEGSGGLTDAISELSRKCWEFIGIALVFGDAITALVDGFRELQTQAYELNMTVNDTENFLRHMRLAGGDIGDFEGFIRGITDAYVKGEVDDPEFIALSKYGAKITDATGRLKTFQEITEEVYQAYLKAKEAGEEIEFLQMVGGESGVRDSIQYFERYAEAKEDAEQIFDAGLDPDELHEADRALKLLTEQLGEFKDAIVNIGINAATRTMITLFEVMRGGTEIVSDSTEAVRNFFSTLHTGYSADWDFPVFDKVWALKDGVFNFLKMWERLKVQERSSKDTFWITDAVEQLRELHFTSNGIDPNDVDMSSRWAWGKYAEDAKEAEEAANEASEAIEGVAASWADFQQKMHGDSLDEPLSQYAAIRIKEFEDELKELRNELDNWDSDYLQSVGELELWRDNELDDKLHVSKEERIAIEALYAAKSEKIERDRADKLEEIREEIAEGDRTALENKIAAIEKAKDEWISAGMEEAEATQLAEKQKNDAITELEEEFNEKIDSLRQTNLEKALAAIEKEKQAWIKKGIDEVKATEWAEQAKVDAQRNAALNALKSQRQELRAFQLGGYAGLQDLYRKQLYASGIKPSDLQMTPEQLQDFEKARDIASRSLLPNFMTEFDRTQNELLSKIQGTIKTLEPPEPQRRNMLGSYALDDKTGKFLFMSSQPSQETGKFEFKDNLSDFTDIPLMLKEKLEKELEKLELPNDQLNEFKQQLEALNVTISEHAKQGIFNSREELLEHLLTQGGNGLEMPTERLQAELDELNVPVDKLNEQLASLDVGQQQSAINDTRVLGATFDYDETINSTITNLTSSFERLEKPLNNVGSLMAKLPTHLETLANKINQVVSDFNSLNVDNLKFTKEVKVDNKISNNISIEEAHAWDMAHINELANRVADVIQPALLNAIRGVGNAY